ncbi:hypothetical protein DICPUDRAFT_84621 [Dictyostelium purpureum]|uniref:Endoplasmic reticulum junction formation protein lunapark n=1 Tax=Dictyostelium purpureum TaxID=5786 RepID=F1A379_DICPU|nr:uncharacterized protein DICPUDRAFT_84621 [Dictyostelium purpureum]EGC29347.1 hypothetical protein DICPUDRAFT_84621 [Dictyostelium purpureum]|eukprot:XP_003294124.1 hypothetical protein DICPUDRAFT_84621 [Dictyostelium purpureum]
MGNFISKKHCIFEKKVEAMESKITAFLYEKFASSDTLSEKAMCFLYSIFASMIIYSFAKFYRLLFERLIKNNEIKLLKLYDGLDKLFEARKLETDYEKTKKLLEDYEFFKKNSNNRYQEEYQHQQPPQPSQPSQPNPGQQPKPKTNPNPQPKPNPPPNPPNSPNLQPKPNPEPKQQPNPHNPQPKPNTQPKQQQQQQQQKKPFILFIFLKWWFKKIYYILFSDTRLLFFENCGNCIGKMPSEFPPSKFRCIICGFINYPDTGRKNK